MTLRTRLIVFAGAFALASPAGVAASQCLEQVEAMAAALGVSTTLPQPADLADEPGEPSGDEAVSALAESDGVIAPPPSGDDMPILEPSAGEIGDMETAPDIEPQPAPDAAAAADPEADAAAATPQVEALLTAARQAAETADEEGCLARLQEAAALAAANGLAVPE